MKTKRLSTLILAVAATTALAVPSQAAATPRNCPAEATALYNQVIAGGGGRVRANVNYYLQYAECAAHNALM